MGLKTNKTRSHTSYQNEENISMQTDVFLSECVKMLRRRQRRNPAYKLHQTLKDSAIIQQ